MGCTNKIEEDGISRQSAVAGHKAHKSDGNSNGHEEDGNMRSNRI